jgi:hypothetical protein
LKQTIKQDEATLKLAKLDPSRRMAWRRRSLWRRGLVFALAAGILALGLIFSSQAPIEAQGTEPGISDVTGEYEFLNPDNTLAILDEDGALKGYIDVFQGDEESDALMSYNIINGSHSKNHVEFRTQKIHEKYYRFSGTAEHGSGKAPGDPDYLQLTGELQTIVDNSVTGHEQVDRQTVTFKSKGRNQESP